MLTYVLTHNTQAYIAKRRVEHSAKTPLRGFRPRHECVNSLKGRSSQTQARCHFSFNVDVLGDIVLVA